MESMDYNYFAHPPQPAYYAGYNEMLPPQSMEHIDSNAFSLANFDYDLTASLPPTAAIPVMPAGSASPPARGLAMLPNGSVDSGIALDADNEHEQRSARRSSSEEKDSLTPAQSRRKAQNRAAQRAFRERKEKHVRDLEAKLNLLTTTTSSLQSDNERLKLMLQRAQTENEILRATASSSPPSHHPPSFVDDPSALSSASTRPQHHTSPSSRSLIKGSPEPHLDAARLASGALSAADVSSSPARYAGSPGTCENHLSASATWDLLQSHPLYLSGAVDIGEVCERLKKMARCDGGPMFEEDEVRKVIEEVGRSGGDELI